MMSSHTRTRLGSSLHWSHLLLETRREERLGRQHPQVQQGNHCSLLGPKQEADRVRAGIAGWPPGVPDRHTQGWMYNYALWNAGDYWQRFAESTSGWAEVTRLVLGVKVEKKALLNTDLVRYKGMKTTRRNGWNLLPYLLDIWLGRETNKLCWHDTNTLKLGINNDILSCVWPHITWPSFPNISCFFWKNDASEMDNARARGLAWRAKTCLPPHKSNKVCGEKFLPQFGQGIPWQMACTPSYPSRNWWCWFCRTCYKSKRR